MGYAGQSRFGIAAVHDPRARCNEFVVGNGPVCVCVYRRRDENRRCAVGVGGGGLVEREGRRRNLSAAEERRWRRGEPRVFQTTKEINTNRCS